MKPAPQRVKPKRDRQTVTSEGARPGALIDGVVIRRAVTQEDERGEICEIFNPAWGVCPAPMVYAYMSTIGPGTVKGWVIHYEQDDRLFLAMGKIRFALFDDRSESSTHGLLNVFTVSERTRALIVIPRGVYHALQNVGQTEAVFFNLPTRPYKHENPDKYRLPLKNDLIPFDFGAAQGW